MIGGRYGSSGESARERRKPRGGPRQDRNGGVVFETIATNKVELYNSGSSICPVSDGVRAFVMTFESNQGDRRIVLFPAVNGAHISYTVTENTSLKTANLKLSQMMANGQTMWAIGDSGDAQMYVTRITAIRESPSLVASV